jgi:hypothetical protein
MGGKRLTSFRCVYFRGCSGYMKTLAPLQLASSLMGGKQLTDFQVLGVKVFAAGGCVGYVHIEYMMATFA